MWDSIGPFLASGGAGGTVLGLAWLAYKLHLDAVGAHSARADAFERIALMHERRADVREAQLGQVLGRASETV